MSEIPLDPLCTCSESSWLAQCYIAGKLVDEAFIDSTVDEAGTIISDVRDKHDALTDLAIASRQPWRVEIYCPRCKKGMRIDSQTGPEVLGADD